MPSSWKSEVLQVYRSKERCQKSGQAKQPLNRSFLSELNPWVSKDKTEMWGGEEREKGCDEYFVASSFCPPSVPPHGSSPVQASLVKRVLRLPLLDISNAYEKGDLRLKLPLY